MLRASCSLTKVSGSSLGYGKNSQLRGMLPIEVCYFVFRQGTMEEEDQEMDSFETRMRKKPRNHLNLNENNVEFLCRTGIGKTVKEGAHQRRQMEMDKSTLVNNSFQPGLRKRTVAEKIMYEKIGYKGGGLGPNEQGMLIPIEVKVYPKNAGLGSVDEPGVLNQSQPSIIQPNKSQNQNRNRNQQRKLYSDCVQRTKEEKRNRVTVEELLEKKNQVHVLDVIYDMRGKQVKVLTSLENLNDEEESIPMAELIHNVRLLVSLCEVDILKIHQDLKMEREIIVALRKEKEELEHDAARQDKQLYSMSEIANELERLSSQCRMGLVTLESLAKSFGDMQKVFPEEFELFGLSTIALDLFHRLFLGWDPLVKPEDDHHLCAVSTWKHLLQDDDIYSRLLMEVVFPVVRISITNTWQPKHPEQLLRFLDSWEELLPQLVLQTILDHVVMPKLSDSVNLWDPRQDTIPIHFWVHPWLVLLGHKLEVLYPTIRTKLEHVLRDWHPSDASAYTVLSPWKDVFNRGA
ncbi:septin and tuftelin-interacting protein 1 homolog 1 [Tanacetum coccineum]